MKTACFTVLALASACCVAAEPVTEPARVTIRDDQTLLVNGKPFFPIGMYSVQDAIADESGAKLRELADIGFNTIIYHGQPKIVELDRIAAAGLRVWYRPPGGLYKRLEQLPGVADAVKDHPALLMWEIVDEPVLNKVPLEPATEGAALIRSLDPAHPVLCNQYPDLTKAEELRQWSQISDVVAFDYYPLPVRDWEQFFGGYVPEGERSIAVMGQLARAFVTDIAAGKPVIAVLQAWNWDSMKYGAEGYPTKAQSRYMAYQCVINGVKGIHYYGIVHVSKPTPLVMAKGDPANEERDFAKAMKLHADFWAGHKEVVRELNVMSPVFTARDAQEQVTVTAPQETHIEHRLKQVGDIPVLLVVNSSAHDAAISIGWSAAAGPIHVWHEDRVNERREEAGVFHEKLPPFGVGVYAPATMQDTLAKLK